MVRKKIHIHKGPGYYVIQYVGGLLFGHNAELFFFVIALLQMLSLVKLYRKYSTDLWMGIFIFVASTDFCDSVCATEVPYYAIKLVFVLYMGSCIDTGIKRAGNRNSYINISGV